MDREIALSLKKQIEDKRDKELGNTYLFYQLGSKCFETTNCSKKNN